MRRAFLLAALTLAATARAQVPCTDSQALEHPGAWASDGDDTAMADPGLPKSRP